MLIFNGVVVWLLFIIELIYDGARTSFQIHAKSFRNYLMDTNAYQLKMLDLFEMPSTSMRFKKYFYILNSDLCSVDHKFMRIDMLLG